VSQSRTMARLGRLASFLSLGALLIVVIQCLWATNFGDRNRHVIVDDNNSNDSGFSLLRKLSAFGSIGFAVGSQKLFLNIRHELANRSTAPRCLAASLSAFGTFYVIIVLLAGSEPPSFLFDAIPPGLNRRLAGLLLWAHVVVSYAINSQAICSSMDRIVLYRLQSRIPWMEDPAKRWMFLTAVMAAAAYTVANAVPFFKDLVSLIGALTSVPLTLLLPAVFWRKHLRVVSPFSFVCVLDDKFPTPQCNLCHYASSLCGGLHATRCFRMHWWCFRSSFWSQPRSVPCTRSNWIGKRR